MKFLKYKKEDDISYTFGQFVTIELIKSKKDIKIIAFLLHDKLVIDESVKFILNYASKNNIEIVHSSKMIENLSGKENCFIIGVFEKYEDKVNNDNQVVLVNPRDMGNMGTIIRSMLGFGYKNLVIIENEVGVCDRFNPKTIRASMGAIFSVNILKVNSYEKYAALYPNIKKYMFCLDTKDTLQSLKEKTQTHALVFGNEATGLPSSITSQGEKVFIAEEADIDSLNLGVSVGIALYEFSKCKYNK